MEAKELLGVDVGRVRTGIARGATVARLPEPLITVSTSKAAETLKELIKKYDSRAIIVGLPRNLQGDDTPQTAWVRNWVLKIKKTINLPFFWQDEALTSLKAKGLELKVKSQLDEHAVAAAIILQDFLDSPERLRVRA